MNYFCLYSKEGGLFFFFNKKKKGHVLKAIGLSDLQANTSIRLSLSKYNTKEEVDYVLEILNKVVNKLRRMSPIK